MNKNIFPLLAVTALAGLSGCSSDDFEQSESGGIANKVVLTSEPYTFEDGTRTTLTNSGSAISFAWDDDETIGIFPIAPTTNNQACQSLNGGTGDGTTSTFDGAGWALKKGNTYAAYYPYVKNLDEDKGCTAVPIDMSGQTQDGNNSLAHIGAGYDYMYAESTVPSSGTMSFDFKHVASIVMLELTMPEAATWTNVTLTGTGSVFTTKGTMNVSTGAVTGTATSSSISLDLDNVTTTSANEKVTLYMAVLPCTTGALTLTAKTSDDKTYTATLATKTLQAGHAYKWTATLSKELDYGNAPDGVEAVDLGLSVKWANMNVGATSVTDYGKYYAWGETKAYGEEDTSNDMNYSYASSYTKTYYDWSTYKYCQGTSETLTKYCTSSSYGMVDNKTTLDDGDDAAAVNWGGSWRIPTYAEMLELVNECTWSWTAINSVNGYKIVGPNGNYIFLPAAGYRYGSKFNGRYSFGYYWSSSLISSNSNYPCCCFFSISKYYMENTDRVNGHSVRPVAK